MKANFDTKYFIFKRFNVFCIYVIIIGTNVVKVYELGSLYKNESDTMKSGEHLSRS